jgi:hypothetical protein
MIKKKKGKKEGLPIVRSKEFNLQDIEALEGELEREI